MNDAQKRSIQLALNFCRDRVTLPKKGSFDYDDVAKQIAALPDAAQIKSSVSWLLDYEKHDSDYLAPPANKPNH